jgi:hypothetical protein
MEGEWRKSGHTVETYKVIHIGRLSRLSTEQEEYICKIL